METFTTNSEKCFAGLQTGASPACFAPPRFVGRPDDSHALQARAFQGIPSLAVGPSGRVWATWYAGCTPGEDHNNYVVAANGSDGYAWDEVLVIDPDGNGPVRAFDPEIWLAPDGRLWLF